MGCKSTKSDSPDVEVPTVTETSVNTADQIIDADQGRPSDEKEYSVTVTPGVNVGGVLAAIDLRRQLDESCDTKELNSLLKELKAMEGSERRDQILHNQTIFIHSCSGHCVGTETDGSGLSAKFPTAGLQQQFMIYLEGDPQEESVLAVGNSIRLATFKGTFVYIEAEKGFVKADGEDVPVKNAEIFILESADHALPGLPVCCGNTVNLRSAASSCYLSVNPDRHVICKHKKDDSEIQEDFFSFVITNEGMASKTAFPAEERRQLTRIIEETIVNFMGAFEEHRQAQYKKAKCLDFPPRTVEALAVTESLVPKALTAAGIDCLETEIRTLFSQVTETWFSRCERSDQAETSRLKLILENLTDSLSKRTAVRAIAAFKDNLSSVHDAAAQWICKHWEDEIQLEARRLFRQHTLGTGMPVITTREQLENLVTALRFKFHQFLSEDSMQEEALIAAAERWFENDYVDGMNCEHFIEWFLVGFVGHKPFPELENQDKNYYRRFVASNSIANAQDPTTESESFLKIIDTVHTRHLDRRKSSKRPDMVGLPVSEHSNLEI